MNTKIDHKPLSQIYNRLLESKFLIAVVLVLFVDLGVRFNFHPDRYQFLQHSLIWWKVRDFNKQCSLPNQSPNIVLFGSSLLLEAVNHGDANFLGKPLDTVSHHRASCLEAELVSDSTYHPNTFSFAIGGQMPSDVFAITDTLLQKSSAPPLVIWGIAPRDFLDNSFPGPASSSTAAYMAKLAQKEVVGDEGMPENHNSFWSGANKTLQKVFCLYGERSDFLTIIHGVTNVLLQNIQEATKIANAKVSGPTLLSGNMTADGRQKFLVNCLDDLGPGDQITSPESMRPKDLIDNSAQYRICYNPFTRSKLETQLSYLEKFLIDSRANGTQVVLINMPITKRNMSLMPPGVYDLYLCAVKNLAEKYGMTMNDFNKNDLFSESDFLDTVHLNGFGGEKFSVLLAYCLKHSPELLSVIKEHKMGIPKPKDISPSALSSRGSVI